MYSIHIFLVLVTLYLGVAQAELFVVQPLEGSTCEANKPCTITWVDNGVRPLLSAVGLSTVGLYTGRQQLVQTIPPVDVSTEHSVTFSPNPSAGANSDTYYIAITSTTLKGNDSIPYSGWSSFFTRVLASSVFLTGMNGSFDTPLPSATSSMPIPSTIPISDGVGTSTRTIGATSKTTVATSTSSRIITSRVNYIQLNFHLHTNINSFDNRDNVTIDINIGIHILNVHSARRLGQWCGGCHYARCEQRFDRER
ncbi:hypothetical protein HYPSUDRAFT_205921 [Hypholoma sublateritium FD-334 SS-4]|uniref:Yeast cell wall synthesis Kre9/Knh1-like N-terminal domain-containing protein n=1 Tax=Hypholoma sublateritium (strain FD-334 SS-4) TaxID=945553 RepID=A0A0D2PC06_HYPSF|nr:hypothetical protein HYPSUDRAFT_205921 [Hypholoma sublateritium FD-334 SS-4]